MFRWLLLFAAPFLAFELRFNSDSGFAALYLLVPLAALLGRRYGVTGVLSVALGGLAFVPSIYVETHGGAYADRVWFGDSPVLYLIALVVAAIAAARRPLLDCLHWPEDDRAATRLTFFAPFLLVLGLKVGPAEVQERAIQLSFSVEFELLVYFLLFAMGARGARMGALLLGLVTAGAMTWALDLNSLLPEWHPGFYIWIATLDPIDVLVALSAFSAGAAMTAFLRGDQLSAFWRQPYWTATALVFLWFGPDPIAQIHLKATPAIYIRILEAQVALPLAAFMAGLLRGARGVNFVTALATVLTLVAAFVAELGVHRFAYVALDAPFAAAAYSVLGGRVAGTVTVSSALRPLRIPCFLVLVLVTGNAILGDGGTVRGVATGVFVVGSLAILIAALRLRRAMADTAFAITSEKWLGFATILALAVAVVAHHEAIADSLRQAYAFVRMVPSIFDPATWAQLRSGRIDAETPARVAGALVIGLIVLLAVVQNPVRTIPKIYADTRQIVAFIRERRRGGLSPSYENGGEEGYRSGADQ